jgi:hypothetical protein
MSTWIRRSVQVGVVSASIVLAGATAAQAQDLEMNSTFNPGIGNGNQLVAPIQLPINVCGNAVNVIGAGAAAECVGGSHATMKRMAAEMNSAGNIGIGNGNQAVIPVQIPVDVCGNAVNVIGAGAAAECVGGATATMKPHRMAALDMHSMGNGGIGNGNQAVVPVQVPVNVCGNAVNVIGAGAAAECKGGATAKIGHTPAATTMAARRGASRLLQTVGDTLGMHSAGNIGIGNGNQAVIPVQVPINVCGNAVNVIGAGAAARCEGGSTATMKRMAALDMNSAGNAGIGNGNQAVVPVQVPVDVCGNAVNVIGANAVAKCQGGAKAVIKPAADGNGGTPGNGSARRGPGASATLVPPTTSMNSVGNPGIGNGNQAVVPVQVPVEVSGNAVNVIGAGAAAQSQGGAGA